MLPMNIRWLLMGQRTFTAASYALFCEIIAIIHSAAGGRRSSIAFRTLCIIPARSGLPARLPG